MRQLTLPLLLILGLSALGCSQETNETAGSPEIEVARLELPVVSGANVVLVTFDALRADALGLYGYDRPTSPRLDAFAGQALVFDRAYVAAPVTPTSFAAALTGMLPHRVFRGWRYEGEQDLPRSFAEAGYATAAFWNNTQLTEERGFGAGFETYRAYLSVTDEEVLDQALLWLEEHRHERFFLWVHFLTPHSPYDYREMAEHLYDPTYQGEYATTTTAKFDTDDPREAARIRSLYDGEVYFADSLFGRFHDAIREYDLLDSSFLLVSSDHGEEFLERGGFQHERLHEETVRVPLLIHHPHGEGAGSRTDLLYSQVDLLPTLGALSGLPVEALLDGANLLEPVPVQRAIVAEAMTDSDYRGVGILRGTHRLILNCRPSVEIELYDLATDPDESDNLETRSPRVARELVNLLRGIYQGDPCARLDDAVRGVEAAAGL
ncbi:MAG TPA: sulfatase, partial [Thermoanaerobaculia bacterium]|nr:sulfatase [Thermoanaerobaculia bacterium]